MSRPSYYQEVELDKQVDQALSMGDAVRAKRIIDSTPQHTHAHTADKVGLALIQQGKYSAAEDVAKSNSQACETAFRLVERTLENQGAQAALKQAANLENKGGVKLVEAKLVADGKLAEPVLPQFLGAPARHHANDLHWATFGKGL